MNKFKPKSIYIFCLIFGLALSLLFIPGVRPYIDEHVPSVLQAAIIFIILSSGLAYGISNGLLLFQAWRFSQVKDIDAEEDPSAFWALAIFGVLFMVLFVIVGSLNRIEEIKAMTRSEQILYWIVNTFTIIIPSMSIYSRLKNKREDDVESQ